MLGSAFKFRNLAAARTAKSGTDISELIPERFPGDSGRNSGRASGICRNDPVCPEPLRLSLGAGGTLPCSTSPLNLKLPRTLALLSTSPMIVLRPLFPAGAIACLYGDQGGLVYGKTTAAAERVVGVDRFESESGASSATMEDWVMLTGYELRRGLYSVSLGACPFPLPLCRRISSDRFKIGGIGVCGICGGSSPSVMFTA
mmetsp:Transcript_39440/g.97390  ORF Transcript_39440/g.97390 Transcript_39440/m.97390 type:complete len:201 (+) Transcript_39440:314-916(+)